MKYLGTIYIDENDNVHITDPGYDNDLWCNATINNFKKGLYEIYTYHKDNCVARIKLLHRDMKHLDKITDYNITLDCIGVDAGLCGFFINKPNYNHDEWASICDYLNMFESPIQTCVTVDTPFKCTGAVCSSGYGDGLYRASLKVDASSKFYCCEVKFL